MDVPGYAQGTDIKIRTALNAIVQDGGCHIFTGGVTTAGYARLKVKTAEGKWVIRPVHRLAWIMCHGNALVAEQMVLHTCDVRRCINPKHHYLGDHQRNMRDMAERNRAHRNYGNKNTLGRTLSDEEKEVRSKAILGMKRTSVTRAKQRAAALARWAKTSFEERRQHTEPALNARLGRI